MQPGLPHTWEIEPEPPRWDALSAAALADVDWSAVRSLPPFALADGTGRARQQTSVRMVASPRRFCVRFDCDDEDIWATMTRRDDPIYEEEAVEVFLAPGADDPAQYHEFEVSPDGVLFDAVISNPDSDRATMVGDPGWDCAGIDWAARRFDDNHRWDAVLAIPWAGLGHPGAPPRHWRANFFRIERPRRAQPEFSCWRPTHVSPADFHKPARFGGLILPREICAVSAHR